MNETIIIEILIGIVITLLLFIYNVIKNNKNEMKMTKPKTNGEILIELIKQKVYEVDTLPNNYPKYPGELEQKDTEEYIEFLKSGILDMLG